MYKAWNRLTDDNDEILSKQTIADDEEDDAVHANANGTDSGGGGDAMATTPPVHNQSELEAILMRVGLQERIAGKVADEVFEKLGRTRNDTITFDDFVSLIHSDVTATETLASEHRRHQRDDDDTDTEPDNHDIMRQRCDIIADLPVTTISSLNMHASRSGLFVCSVLILLVYLCNDTHRID